MWGRIADSNSNHQIKSKKERKNEGFDFISKQMETSACLEAENTMIEKA